MALNWDDIGGGLLNAGLGYWSSSQGVNAADQAAAAAGDADAKRRLAFSTESAKLSGLAPTVAAGYAMKPANVSTAFAKSKIDPTTGNVGYDLTPETQGLFSGYMGGAQKSLDLAGNFDPKAMAAERLAAQQELLAPSRAAEDAKLIRMLQAKGLTGLSSSEGSPTGGGQNPYAAALYGARSQADKKAAYDSLSEGESYLDRLLNRSRGMFSNAKDVEGTGQNALKTGADWTDRFTRNESERTRATTDLMRKAYEAERLGAYDQTAMDRILEAQKRAGSAGALQTSGMIKGGTDILNNVLKGAGGLSGLFGGLGGSSTPSWFDTASYSGGFDLGGYDDMWSDWGTGADFGNFDYADYL